MTGEVKALFGMVPPGEAVPEIVAELKALLEQAERGELRGFAYGLAFANGTATHGWHAEQGASFPMIVAVTGLHWAIGQMAASED